MTKLLLGGRHRAARARRNGPIDPGTMARRVVLGKDQQQSGQPHRNVPQRRMPGQGGRAVADGDDNGRRPPGVHIR
jgi:hypothetical protein